MFGRFRTVTGKNFSIKFKTQLVASFVGMSFIILLISFLFIYMSMVSILKKQSEQENLKHFQQLEYNIGTFMNEVDKISSILFISKELQDFLDGRFSSDTERVILVNSVFSSLAREVNNYEYIESIYYFGENGQIIGVTPKRNNYIEDSEKKKFFYCSEIYEMVKADNSKVHWYGGYSSDDFGVYDMGSKGNYRNYITAARSINFFGRQTATLVININLNFFTNIYNTGKIEKYNNMYLMDGSGRIFSHTDKSRLNTISSVFGDLNEDSSYGSLILKRNPGTMQIVYYRMNETRWILVNEIPLYYLVKDITKLRKILLLMFGISFAMAFGMSLYWIYRITRPLNELTAAMGEMEKGRLGHMLPETSGNELGILGRQFNKMSASILSLIEQIKTMENEKRNLQIESLQARINPHFLYNTLNTIKYMAVMLKANNIAESLTTLGNILKPIFKNPSILCTIEEEVEYVKNYIRIMNYRYGEGIKVNISIPDELLEYEILRFILQPLIENSLYYGIVSQNLTGIISISASRENGGIQLIVEDNGEGMNHEKLMEVRRTLDSKAPKKNEADGIGISNVNRRIVLHYGYNYGIDIYSRKGSGTKVILRLP